MRTTLALDDDVLEAAREIASGTGRSLGAVVSDLARRSLRPVGWHYVNGFPVFDVPADAPMVTDEDVARARDDE